MAEISEGTKRMMQKRREAARAGEPGFDWAHWYNKDVGRLLKQLRDAEERVDRWEIENAAG